MARKKSENKRETISKKVRFEVFKRDKFTCQYCGKKSPDVVLNVDHIKPVADGGKSDILNLVTACLDCNSGKGARVLADTAILDAQRAQLEELQERREQLEMLIEWRDELSDLGTTKVVALERAICEEFGWEGISEYARGQIKSWLKKYSLEELFDALNSSSGSYLKHDATGPTKESTEKVFHMIPRVANVTRVKKTKPWIQDLLYIKGILRNRLHYVGDRRATELLTEAFEAGYEGDYLKEIAKDVRNWAQWQNTMEAILGPPEGGEN